PDTPEKTILVRSGPEDTLVLFVEGNTLRQSEHLPELTAEDSAETICSRVLLLQDEYGMGEVQHLMLIAEEDERELADAFKSYFANADLRLLRTHLPDGEEAESGAYVAATGAALRGLEDPNYEPFFQPVNLLAKRYTASTFRLPVGWSVPVLLGLLAATTLGFVWYYFSNASVISERRAQFRTLEQQVQQVDPQALQRRIDSLQSVATQYAAANTVVESLLYGSNKWSKGLATLAEQVNRLEGLTVRQWTPEGETEVTVAGRANERAKVVQLARRLNGEILDLTFTETRDVSLYDFQLTIPLDTTKPEAIKYWREQRGKRLAAVDQMTQLQTSTADTSDSGETTTASSRQKGSSTTTASASSGEGTAPTGTGWTVVVASLAQRPAAEKVVRRFRNRLGDAEHPVQIHRYAARDRYRVGIGHFGSTDAAASVLREMDGELPEDAWLLRVSEESPPDSSATASATAVQSARSAPGPTVTVAEP
ncbi:MAG: SPOR domain-containing protein, partial [Salinibacter sp.]